MITIGKHQVGAGQKPFIIAEVGSNWQTFDDCKDSIAKAASCGADAVKFQAYDHKALYGVSRRSVAWGGLEDPNRDDVVFPGTLPLEWLPKLKAKADACGIEFMCSAFSPELVEAVDPYVNVHKVASAEMTHIRILEKLRKLGKPVILSTGASGEADIRGALHVLTAHPDSDRLGLYSGSNWGPNEGKSSYHYPPVPVILMYCVAAYPANEVNLDTLPLLRGRFGIPVGYSDHTTDVGVIPEASVRMGACVLEKHFTGLGDLDSPDRPHSLTAEQFAKMVRYIRGDVATVIGPSGDERPMILRHNRRVLAITDIAVGQSLQEGVNFGIYRSLKDDTNGAHPFMIGSMVGKAVKRAIAAGDGIGPGDV